MILNNITLSLGIYAFDTAGFPVPVPGHFSITVHGNASMAKETQIKLLPGAQLTVEKGATLTVEGSDSSVKGGLSSYDGNAAFDSGVTQWKDGTDAYSIAQFKTVYRTAPTPDYSAATPAVILVKGTQSQLHGVLCRRGHRRGGRYRRACRGSGDNSYLK